MKNAQSDYALRTKAIVSVLTKKNLINPEAMDAVVDFYENKVGPHIGARMVAKSWVDPDYRRRLLEDARAVIREEGNAGEQGTDLIVVENSENVHNLVVCTLCSCYPWPVLGLPPTWYKDAAYRAQSVIDPRGVLRKFGLELDDDVEVRVWDSTAEVRYPRHPGATARNRRHVGRRTGRARDARFDDRCGETDMNTIHEAWLSVAGTGTLT